jgi:hypothetical protein
VSVVEIPHSHSFGTIVLAPDLATGSYGWSGSYIASATYARARQESDEKVFM